MSALTELCMTSAWQWGTYIPVMPFLTIQMRRKSQSFAWTNAWMWTRIENLHQSSFQHFLTAGHQILRHTLTLPSKKPFWHAINVKQHKNSQVGEVFSRVRSKLVSWVNAACVTLNPELCPSSGLTLHHDGYQVRAHCSRPAQKPKNLRNCNIL